MNSYIDLSYWNLNNFVKELDPSDPPNFCVELRKTVQTEQIRLENKLIQKYYIKSLEVSSSGLITNVIMGWQFSGPP